MNEDTSSIQLIDPEGHLISLIKSDVKELTPLKVSAMPSYQDRLTPGELSDVLAYLRSLNACSIRTRSHRTGSPTPAPTRASDTAG
jgi:hypothetical protein